MLAGQTSKSYRRNQHQLWSRCPSGTTKALQVQWPSLGQSVAFLGWGNRLHVSKRSKTKQKSTLQKKMYIFSKQLSFSRQAEDNCWLPGVCTPKSLQRLFPCKHVPLQRWDGTRWRLHAGLQSCRAPLLSSQKRAYPPCGRSRTDRAPPSFQMNESFDTNSLAQSLQVLGL